MSITHHPQPLVGRIRMEAQLPEVDGFQRVGDVVSGIVEGLASGRFRKRPVEVEAWLCPGGWELPEDAPQWVRDAYVWPPSPNRPYREISAGRLRPEMGFEDWVWRVGTLEGVISAAKGDWIIRGVAGELYPCKPDIFAATYEPVGRAA